MNEAAIRARMQQSRKARDISRQKFGQMLGYTGQSIENYEKRNRGIPYADLPRWADITGVPVSWLLFGEQALEPMDAIDALHRRLDALRADLGLEPDRLDAGERGIVEQIKEQGVSEPLAGEGEGPLLSDAEDGKTSPKAAKPKAGRRQSSRQRSS